MKRAKAEDGKSLLNISFTESEILSIFDIARRKWNDESVVKTDKGVEVTIPPKSLNTPTPDYATYIAVWIGMSADRKELEMNMYL